MPQSDVTPIVGDGAVGTRPRPPFDAIVCEFLSALSTELRQDENAKQQPDVMTFAFWCRAGNIERIKARYGHHEHRLGRGRAFHIAPSNVPITFAYSFAFSLLAGNTNIVRVPSSDFPQIDIVSAAVRSVLSRPVFKELQREISFIRYPAGDTVTAFYSSRCDARIIWGGDATAGEIRAIPLPPRALDLIFSDRYSFCILAPEAVLALPENQLERLAEGFYNDTYLMDQNACSSPHLIVWLTEQPDTVPAAQKRFWAQLQKIVARRYDLASVHAVDKYTQLLSEVIQNGTRDAVTRYGNEVYTIDMKSLPDSLDDLRGKFGLFYEYVATDLSALVPRINSRFQTLTYFGTDKERLQDFVINNRLQGIDRIVPIGQALDIDIMWDGYDIVRHLSRLVDVR